MVECAKWSNTLDAFEIDAHLLCYITTVLLITGLICVSLNSWPYVECIHVGNPILLDVPESCYSTWVSYPSSMCILPFSRTSHWTYAPNYVWALKICTQLRLSSKNRLVPLRTSPFMIRSMINSWEQAANRKYAMNEHQSRTHQVYYFISHIWPWLWNVTVIYPVIHKLNQLLQGNTLEYCVNCPHEITSKLKEKRSFLNFLTQSHRFSFNFDVVSCGKCMQYSSLWPSGKNNTPETTICMNDIMNIASTNIKICVRD